MTIPLIDAHLDLALNALNYDRDLTLPLEETNAAEEQMADEPFRGRATITLPELRDAGVHICLATLLARSGPRHTRPTGYSRCDMDFATQTGAHCAAMGQLAWYRLMESRGELSVLETKAAFDTHWTTCETSASLAILLTMEGADPISEPAELDVWHQRGLRALGLSHYGPGRYAAGTNSEGGITTIGRDLLAGMERLGMGLDVTHLTDQGFDEALDLFGGTVWASHHNSRKLVPWQRQLTDEQIRALVSRDAVIGAAFDAIMLQPGWQRGTPVPEDLKIAAVAEHIENVCAIAGNTRHVGIGTDLDGGFGTEQTPTDLSRYRDVQRLAEILSQRGYTDDDVRAIFYGNWLRKLRDALP